MKLFSDAAGTILTPPLCLPQSKGTLISRSHAALNLLSCLHTASSHPPLNVEALSGKKMKTFATEDYQILMRFNCKYM